MFFKENATFLIAIISFFLSIGQLFYGIWKRRYHLKLTNTGYMQIEVNKKPKTYVFGFFIENHSSNPLNVLYLSALCHDGTYCRCTLTHRFLKEHFMPPGLDRPYQFFTTDFPIHLDAHTSKLIFVMFTSDRNKQILFFNSGMVRFNIKSDLRNDYQNLPCTQRTNFLDQ